MIHFILARNNSFTIKKYLGKRGKSIANIVKIIYYDNLTELLNLRTSAIIFSDFDRLTSDQLEEVKKIHTQIKVKYPELILINDPTEVKLRFDLLKQLKKAGINNYDVFRLTEPLHNLPYPVFLREQNNHTGALSELIYDLKTLERNVLALNLQGYPNQNMMAVEFVNVATKDGVYKKYSALKVKDGIYPRQLDYDMHWMVKTSIRFNIYPEKEFDREFEEYVSENPHKLWLERVFKIAGIDYGRIDYGVFEGRPIVWEINLNPDYGNRRRKDGEKPNQTVDRIRGEFHLKLLNVFLEIEANQDALIELEISERVLKTMKPSGRVLFWEKFHNLFKTKKPFFKKMVKFLRVFFLLVARFLLLLLRPLGYSPLRTPKP